MKYHLITLGCPKNKVDSDGIEMLLQHADYRATESARDADVLIVNTCGFLETAKEESIGVLQELGRRKRKHQLLVAAGCLVQRNGAEVIERVPKVDGLLGTRRWMDVLDLIGQMRSGKARNCVPILMPSDQRPAQAAGATTWRKSPASSTVTRPGSGRRLGDTHTAPTPSSRPNGGTTPATWWTPTAMTTATS